VWVVDEVMFVGFIDGHMSELMNQIAQVAALSGDVIGKRIIGHCIVAADYESAR
jgi:hypothetical protein